MTFRAAAPNSTSAASFGERISAQRQDAARERWTNFRVHAGIQRRTRAGEDEPVEQRHQARGWPAPLGRAVPVELARLACGFADYQFRIDQHGFRFVRLFVHRNPA